MVAEAPQVFGPCVIRYSFDGSPATLGTDGDWVETIGYEIAGIVLPVVTLGTATSVSIVRIGVKITTSAGDAALPVASSNSTSNLLGALTTIIAPGYVIMSPGGSSAQGGDFPIVAPYARLRLSSAANPATRVLAGFVLRPIA